MPRIPAHPMVLNICRRILFLISFLSGPHLFQPASALADQIDLQTRPVIPIACKSESRSHCEAQYKQCLVKARASDTSYTRGRMACESESRQCLKRQGC